MRCLQNRILFIMPWNFWIRKAPLSKWFWKFKCLLPVARKDKILERLLLDMQNHYNNYSSAFSAIYYGFSTSYVCLVLVMLARWDGLRLGRDDKRRMAPKYMVDGIRNILRWATLLYLLYTRGLLLWHCKFLVQLWFVFACACYLSFDLASTIPYFGGACNSICGFFWDYCFRVLYADISGQSSILNA